MKNQIINSKGSIIAFHSIRKELFNLKTKEDVYKKILSYLGQIVDYENGSIFVKEGNNLLQVDKKGNGKLDRNFFPVTDGTTQESLYYGDVLKYNTVTKKESKDYMLSLLNPVRKEGKPVFVINYAKGNEKKDFLLKEDAKTGFVSELFQNLTQGQYIILYRDLIQKI